MSMLGELSRRNVIRVAIAYVIAAWVMIQVADLVLENISAPDWVIQSMMLVVALGFPIALIFSWAYEVTPEGIKRESEIDRSQSITGVTGRKLDRSIIALLVVAVAYFAWGSREIQAPTTEPPQIASDASPAAATSNVDSLSIAVLPFDNRSNREEDEFFTAGMHDDLLTTIAKIGSLKVISRTSVMEYKDTTKKIPEIARELGVANILEGGVQRSGNQVRINMQLIDAATDRHLWAENYDRVLTAENLFAIQSEISQAVATALQAILTPDEQRRINTAPTNSLDAHDAYLRARQLMETREAMKLEEAAVEFQRAVELDPQFALAWVGLADTHDHLNIYGTMSIADSLAVREPAIAKALAIAPDLGEAYASLSHVHSDNGRPDDAESALRKAIELSPNYATSYHWLSNHLRDNILRLGEALEFGETSRELDPRSRIIGVNLAGIYRRSGDFPAAKREIYRVLQLDPGFALGHSVLSALYRDAGDLDEYVRSMVTYTDLDPGGAFNPANLVLAYVEINAIDAANTAFAPLHEAFPDHVATARASLTIAAANGEEKRIRKSLPPLLNSDFGQFFDVIAASGYTMLGDYDLAREAILNSSPTDDLLLPASWPNFIARYPEAACLFARVLMQTGDAERGEMLVAEALRHFEELFPKVISHVDRYSPDLCYLTAGDTEKALASIERQYEHGHIATWNINHRLPLYDPIRENPRYVAVREQYEIKLAELREAAGL